VLEGEVEFEIAGESHLPEVGEELLIFGRRGDDSLSLRRRGRPYRGDDIEIGLNEYCGLSFVYSGQVSEVRAHSRDACLHIVIPLP
jgi:hypothetical protein